MEIRKALLTDVEEMMILINDYAEQGLMLPRSRSMIYENIREFILVVENKKIVGVGSLHILWSDLAEIRALAISNEYRRKGLGTKLVQTLEDEARGLGCARVFALTYQPDFFVACDYRVVNKEDLPQKVWKECIHCVKFPNCDEIAVVHTL